MSASTPLAWKNLTHDARRLLVSVAGVGFAVLLIFMQLGFRNALLESTVQVLRGLNGELVVLSRAKYALPATERFDLRRIYQAGGTPGVAAIYPFYMETLYSFLRPAGGRGYPIRVLAWHPHQPTFRLRWLTGARADLESPGIAAFDRTSRAKYRFPAPGQPLDQFSGELAGQRLRLAGTFYLGVDFATDGNLVMTAENIARFFPQRSPGGNPLDQVDLAVVQLEPGADVNATRAAIARRLPADVQVLRRDELIEREKAFWNSNAPIGYIFFVGVIVGILVGVVICYQIIYSDIADHLREFATLKAMGYGNRYFLRMALTQGLYLSVLGFVPSLLVTAGAYYLLARYTGLTMQLSGELVAQVFVFTVFMCCASGLFALRRLWVLDPAELF